MDENPDAARTGSTRRRPGWSSIRIRTKLAIMLLIPALTLTAMVTVRLVESTIEARSAGETADVVKLAETVNEAMRSIQEERILAALLVFQADLELDEDETNIARFEQAEADTDEHLAALEQARSELGEETELTQMLDEAGKPLDRLPVVRRAAFNESIEEVHLTVYNSAIARLTAVVDFSVDVADITELSRSLRITSLLNSIDENTEQLRLLVLSLEDGKPLAGDYRPFVRLVAAREEALSEYRHMVAQIDPNAVVFNVGGLGAGDARTANRLESQVVGSRSDDDQEIDHATLMGAYDARHNATSGLVAESLTETVETAEGVRSDVVQRLAIEGAIAVVALAVAVLIAFAIGRSVTSGLRDMSSSARQVAMVDLPQAVKRVDEQEGLGGQSPFEFAAQTTPPLRTKGNDELAEVGEAFNIIHREAIRISAQQALLRYHIGAIFVRLARRGHSLASRLTAELDEAERNEQDPDRLERLFRLDHLVSLLGRANDSLLVLGGASGAQIRRDDIPLTDVLSAAQGRVEYYTRVELMADEGAWIKAEAVDDVVQLLAELIDNGTRYSEATAEVVARVLTGRVIVQIRDHGIGIDPERMAELNDRLGRRAQVDLEAMQAMGLTVVGHLAVRHGIEVELRPSIGGGTVAEIALPSGVLSFDGKNAQSRGGPPAAITGGPKPAPPRPRLNAPLFDQQAAEPAAPPDQSGPASLPGGPRLFDPDATMVLAQLPTVHFDAQSAPADPSQLAGAPVVIGQTEEEVTEGGLPMRRPMSNLVPGAVAPSSERAGEPIRRDPKTIGATYSAYARGLSGTRTKTQETTDVRTSS